MENSSNLSLPCEKCMKCRAESEILLSSIAHSGVFIGLCDHKCCQSCFRRENMNIIISTNNTFNCPCCHSPFYKNMISIDEAILVGEAATIRTHIIPGLLLPRGTEISEENLLRYREMNCLAIEKFENALQLNPTNFDTLYSLFHSCGHGYIFVVEHNLGHSEFYRLKLFDCCYSLLDHTSISEQGNELVRSECYCELAVVFYSHRNYFAALKYAKLGYESSLRSADHGDLARYKGVYLTSRAAFAELPPLRFGVGDEVEFLHECETGSEWKLGKIVELHYRERAFDVSFTAPYRLQLLKYAEPPVYAYVKADIDRYVRKVGVRSIEDTRYQARLDAKVEELAQVFCSKALMLDICVTLAQDQEFVDMIRSVWSIELTDTVIQLYRALVMLRETLVRTDSGYHVPTADEVITGIRAFFDPGQLSGNIPTTVCEDSDSKRIRDIVVDMLRGTSSDSYSFSDESDIEVLLFRCVKVYVDLLLRPDSSGHAIATVSDGVALSVTLDVSEAISKVSTVLDLTIMLSNGICSPRLENLLIVWVGVQMCLEHPTSAVASECPFIYFFIKSCHDRGLGVPKLALAMYDKMNIQLSREFIRCANPTCELNKLDKSTGKIKFKNCSRCKAVIYCSKECQVAHYPEHKALCREHATG